MKRLLKLGTFAALAACAGVCRAQEFQFDLSETVETLAAGALAPGAGAIPPTAPEATKYPMPPGKLVPLIDALPGRPLHPVDAPPESAAWWKYPIYGVVGLPRDAVDSVFGFVANIPVLNLVFVGVAYEVIPTQAIMRDPRDWHRWPGRRNKRGHGWVDSEGWGWFPTAHSMKFTYPNKRKLEKWKAENEVILADLQTKNKEIETGNTAIAEAQKTARTAAVAAIDRGNGQEATARMIPFHLAAPQDETAHALMINALAVYADGGPDWVRPALMRELALGKIAVLRQSEALLAKSAADHASNRSVAEALILVRTRLDDHAGALAEAKRVFEALRGGAGSARVYFEASLGARDAVEAQAAYDGLKREGARGTLGARDTFRLALLQGEATAARGQIAPLAQAEPENAYYQYYLGAAEVEALASSPAPQASIDSAVDHFERATLGAPIPPLAERAGRALNYARRLNQKPGEEGPKKKKAGLIGFEQ